MTAGAMTVGMVPMALALERGSQMQAPLGLAVIGGLVMSTFATLLVLPSIFAIVIGRKVAHSPSIYPDDRDSTHYDPLVYAGRGPRRPRGRSAGGPPVRLDPHVPTETATAPTAGTATPASGAISGSSPLTRRSLMSCSTYPKIVDAR